MQRPQMNANTMLGALSIVSAIETIGAAPSGGDLATEEYGQASIIVPARCNHSAQSTLFFVEGG